MSHVPTIRRRRRRRGLARLVLSTSIVVVSAAIPGPALAADLALVGGTVLPVAGPAIEGGAVLVRDGEIVAVGPASEVEVPDGARVIDCTGRFVTPGIIDTHSHMGVYPWTIARGNGDGNEATAPATPQVRAEDGIYLDDPAFARARAGGVTTILVIPGSANLVGGEGVVLKLRPSGRLAELRFEGAPRHVKMAMGENPKRVYGNKGRTPSTRMGNLAYLRERFAQAKVYRARWEEMQRLSRRSTLQAGLDWPEVDHELERLADILAGGLRVQVHCYTTSDIQALLRLADDVGFEVAAIDHALEAYKVRDVLAERGVGVCTWADWWGFKQEAWDAIPENAALCAEAGVTVAIHSDSSSGVQRLWHEAAKTVATGATEAQALEAITLGPARILGVDERVGTLEPGKDADIAVFSKHPFDVTTRVDLTLIDGEVVFDRAEADAAVWAEIQARTRRPAAPEGPVVIRGARLLPVSGPPIEDGVVELRAGRIVAVGGPDTPVSPGAEVIDASGKTVFPGLIDAACRVGLVEVQSDPSHRELSATGGLFMPHVRVTDGLNPDSETIRVARAAGVTTCIVTPDEGNPMAGLAAAIDLDGRTVDDMIAMDAVALCLNFGNHPVGTGRGKGAFGTRMELVAKLRETLLEAERYARKLERHEAERARHAEAVAEHEEALSTWESEQLSRDSNESVSPTVTADVLVLGDPAESKRPDEPGLPPMPPDRKLDMEALQPVLSGQVPVLIRAHTDRDIRQALRLCDEFGLRPILSRGTEAYRARKLLAERGVPVVLGPVTTQPGRFETWNAVYENAALLHEAGVPFCLQTSSSHNVRTLRFEAGIAVAWGLPPDTALRALTLDAATIYGLDVDYGSLEAGKVANLVIATGDPLQPTSRIERVFIRGREVELTSRQTRLRDRHAPRTR